MFEDALRGFGGGGGGFFLPAKADKDGLLARGIGGEGLSGFEAEWDAVIGCSEACASVREDGDVCLLNGSAL